MEHIENIFGDETLDELNKVNKRIIQKKEGFRFSVDAVLIANFLNIKSGNLTVMDIGTGTGIVPLLISDNTHIKKIYGVEIQKENAMLAKRSVKYNELEEKIEILNEDIKKLKVDFKIDLIVTNPPYIKSANGKISENIVKALSKHEIELTIKELIENSKRILKSGGSFNIICRTNRFQETFFLLSENNFYVKRLRTVHSKPGKEAMLFMIEAIKDTKCTMEIMDSIHIFNESGEYTDEVLEYY
jgi:tRNA1Val (adenine37-N6)-methyltransferase